MPASVEVFGYPFAERKLKGVWREFAVGGPTAASTVQLHWTRDAGSLLGHSGGPVVDSVEYRPVGILIEGSEPGQFDRFLPVTMIARVWPDLWRPSLITGVEQGGAEQLQPVAISLAAPAGNVAPLVAGTSSEAGLQHLRQSARGSARRSRLVGR